MVEHAECSRFAAPGTVTGLEAMVLNRTNLRILWQEPVIKNGPLDGYLVGIYDDTDSAVKRTFTVTTSSFTFNTTDEYET